jgi:hypothetical protein
VLSALFPVLMAMSSLAEDMPAIPGETWLQALNPTAECCPIVICELTQRERKGEHQVNRR